MKNLHSQIKSVREQDREPPDKPPLLSREARTEHKAWLTGIVIAAIFLASVVQDQPISFTAIARVLQSAISSPAKPRTFVFDPGASFVTQEIHYIMAEGGEVNLAWGINGWRSVPKEIRPKGAYVGENGIVSMQMMRQDDTFVAKLSVPDGTIIDYGFWISKTRSGETTGVWDGNGYPPGGYQTIAREGGVTEILSTVNLAKAQALSKASYVQLVTLTIRYQSAQARDVFLVWGINGRHAIPEEMRPFGTIVRKDGAMSTPMTPDSSAFDADAYVVNVRAPVGSTIDYGFLITMIRSGELIRAWEADGPQDLHWIAKQNGIVTVKSKLK